MLNNHQQRFILMPTNIFKIGIILAACANFSVLIFSRGFSNTALNSADPIVMSNFGLLMIILWGLTYLACLTLKGNIKWLLGVFVLEKLIYVVLWVIWLFTHSLQAVYAKDYLAGIFYSIYGLNDLLFMLFFSWAFLTQHKLDPKKQPINIIKYQ